ncbi:MAG: AAA family ATPase [Pseudomonadota bacterium]
MYRKYWGLTEKPFENTPDPRFFYRSQEHEEGLLRLLYAIQEAKGAAMLTGVFGCGKTLLGRELMREMGKDVYKVVCISNPLLTSLELLMMITTELGVTDLPTKKTEVLTSMVLQRLGCALNNNLNDGRRTVIIIDEAHIITEHDVWEELRLLLNYQLDSAFLLTLLLMGQPELKKSIDSNKQLSQRIAIRHHLKPLSVEETTDYVLHRLNVAGRSSALFDDEALKVIYEKAGGIPRRINHICDLCLLTGFSRNLQMVGADVVREVAADLEG